jgi:hypothetical protein
MDSTRKRQDEAAVSPHSGSGTLWEETCKSLCSGFLMPCLDESLECSSCSGGKPTVLSMPPQGRKESDTKFLASETARSGHVTWFHQSEVFTEDLVRN